MLSLTIKSRKLGATFEFSRPGSEYIWARVTTDRPAPPFQPCEGGRTKGATLRYRGTDQAEFEAICRRWYRAYVRHAA